MSSARGVSVLQFRVSILSLLGFHPLDPKKCYWTFLSITISQHLQHREVQWIAAMLLATCTSSATSALKGAPEAHLQEAMLLGTWLWLQKKKAPFLHALQKEDGLQTKKTPFLRALQKRRLHGGSGPPRICKLVGGDKPFHDGGGLCAPDRWPHETRGLPGGQNWSWLRDRLFRTRVGLVSLFVTPCAQAGAVRLNYLLVES